MWHSWLLLFALLLGLVSLALGDDTFCFSTGNCYTINTTALAFDKANMTCGFKGFLATMKNQQEMNEILSTVSHLQDQRNISTFWLGLYLPACVVIDKELYGFFWVSGGDAAEVNYWNATPKQSCTTKRKCVILESRKNMKSAFSLVWKDVRCERKFPFICRSTKSKQILATKDIEMVTHSSTDQFRTHTSVTDQYTTHTSITSQPTEMYFSTSQINVLCRELSRNVSSSCTVTISHVCNATHCSCGNNDGRVLYKHKRCNEIMNTNCLEQCIKSMNISCSCSDHHNPCEEECTTGMPSPTKAPVSQSTNLHSAISTSHPFIEDDNLLDGLITPLILGLVAFGILVMLVWGGVQMCIRKRKPKRRKSIAPAPPEGSDTDSTDHSSSEEEDDDDEEEGDGESQNRTEDP